MSETPITTFLRERFDRMAVRLDSGFRGRIDGESAVQEALIRAWLLSERGYRIDSMDSWLGTVASNVARSEVRHRASEERALRRWATAYGVITPISAPGPDPGGDDPDVIAAVLALPDRQRQIVALRYWADLDLAQIAGLLGISAGTVKSSLHRARRTLADTLSTYRKDAPTMPGWDLQGTAPHDYSYGRIADAPGGEGVLALRVQVDRPVGFGTVMQTISAAAYRGRRLRLRADLRTDEAGWAAMWMRVDPTEGSKPLAFDNMRDRSRRGTTPWEVADVVLDIAPEAHAIAFGVLLHGAGTAYVRRLSLVEVGSDVPTTDRSTAELPAAPADMELTGLPVLDDQPGQPAGRVKA